MLALLLSGSLVAFGLGQEGGGRVVTTTLSMPGDTPKPAGAHRRSISHLLLAHFPLLHTSKAGLPAIIRQSLQAPFPGMSWSLAREIPTPFPGSYWLAPGLNHLCIVATNPQSRSIGTVCTTINRALRHGIANTSLDPVARRRVIVGVVPQGTRAVLLQSGEEITSVKVHHGRFMLRDAVPAPPDRLTLR
jgi:hypothetical protein